ncbi:MAG TPA: lysoplasmalogenase family protein, partial [Acidimicrobiales bacterium]|nr:lysoplasmalogenase family protein [Acidimicrobiales bacterium]
MCKPAVMAVLIAIALRLHPDSAAERRWFVAALVLSLAGDVALMLDKFEVGLGSFLLAHLAYIAGFLALGAALPRFLGAALVLAFVGWAVGGTVLRAVGRSPLRVPVGLYMAAISVMAACALGTGRWLAALGALLFY